MKPFKLNAFEKFVIHRKKAIEISLYIFLIISYFIIDICKHYINKPIAYVILIAVVLICVFYNEIMPVLKNAKVTKAHENLDMDYALDGINKLIDAVNPKDTERASNYRNNKIAFLMDAGKYEEAEKEIKTFFENFDTKKLSSDALFTVHLNLAQLKTLKGNKDDYKSQKSIVEGYYEQVRKSKLKNLIGYADHCFDGLVNSETAFHGDYDESFEQKVLDHIKFFGGEEVKKIPPIDYLNAYFTLFTYFNRLGNTEKADYYAHKVTEIGNSGYQYYRIAKEYLENADRSN